METQTTLSTAAQINLHVAAVHNIGDTYGALARAAVHLMHIKRGGK